MKKTQSFKNVLQNGPNINNKILLNRKNQNPFKYMNQTIEWIQIWIKLT